MEYKEGIRLLAGKIKDSRRVCVFTGAGISCPSGIPDFRSADGLYNSETKTGVRPETIISHPFFVSNPEMFYEFYKKKMLYPLAKPNRAHLYFAGLEKSGKSVSVVTQNIYGLHQAAGSRDVIELHGSVHRNHCTKCGAFYSLEYIEKSTGVPRCAHDGGIIKPDVVLYGEQLDERNVSGAIHRITNADLMIIVGTSLSVYPAASYVRYFNGDCLAIINKTLTGREENADIIICGDAEKAAEALSEYNKQ